MISTPFCAGVDKRRTDGGPRTEKNPRFTYKLRGSHVEIAYLHATTILYMDFRNIMYN
jgi:hypothetical protein